MPAYYERTPPSIRHRYPEVTDLDGALKKVLASPTVASKEWVYNQYDYMVRTSTAVRPGSDAAVVTIPRHAQSARDDDGLQRTLCVSRSGSRRTIAVAEAARNVVCSGAEPLAITDNLNFGSPEKPEIFWQLEKAADGMAEACRVLDTPVIGGNVSLYNENAKGAIYPTPVVGMVGLVHDLDHITTQGFKKEGDVIFLLGETKAELGGSEFQYVDSRCNGRTSAGDRSGQRRKSCSDAVLEAIRAGLVASAHDLSEGGLAVALAESCISGGFGAEVECRRPSLRADIALFSESQSRILLTAAPEKADDAGSMRSQQQGCAVCSDRNSDGDATAIRVNGERAVIESPVDAAGRGLEGCDSMSDEMNDQMQAEYNRRCRLWSGAIIMKASTAKTACSIN